MNNKTLKISLVILLLAMISLSIISGTLASNDTARVAKYMLELTNTNNSITEFIPNSTQSVSFSVKNYNGQEKNEVKLRYKIILDTPVNSNLPINYRLYRVHNANSEEEIILTNGVSSYIEMEMVNVIHEYRLDLIWQNGCDEIIYQNLVDNIKISIDSEQID